MSTEKIPQCPSVQSSNPVHRAFAVVGGSVEKPEVRYLDRAVPVTRNCAPAMTRRSTRPKSFISAGPAPRAPPVRTGTSRVASAGWRSVYREAGAGGGEPTAALRDPARLRVVEPGRHQCLPACAVRRWSPTTCCRMNGWSPPPTRATSPTPPEGGSRCRLRRVRFNGCRRRAGRRCRPGWSPLRDSSRPPGPT